MNIEKINFNESEIKRSWANNDIKLSICILAFNHSEYIAKAILGALSQKTTFAFKLIIHDDCSTDSTLEIIHKIQNKFPSLIEVITQKDNQHSKGICPFLNIMLPNIQTEYIAILDGDDQWINIHKIQEQFEVLDENKDISLVHHNANVIDAKNNFIKKYHSTDIKELSFRDIISQNKIISSSTFFRNEMFKNLYNRVSDTVFTDRIIWIFLLRNKKAFYINKIFGAYRKHSYGIDSGSTYLNKSRKRFFARTKLLGVDLGSWQNILLQDNVLRISMSLIFMSFVKLRLKECKEIICFDIVLTKKYDVSFLRVLIQFLKSAFLDIPRLIYNKIF